MKEKQKIILIAIIIVLILALLLCFEIIFKDERDLRKLRDENEKLNSDQVETVGTDTTNVEGSNETEEVGDITAEDIFNNRQDIIERTLKMYGLTDNGIELLYTEDENVYNACLFLYDTQKDIDEMFAKTDQTVFSVNGKEYNLYKTGIDYKEYEEAVKELVSQEIFDNYFTQLAENIDGKLYILQINEGKETEKYEIKEITEIDEAIDEWYEVTYIYSNGDTKEERTTKVSFTQNAEGLDVINNIELK